MFVSRNVGQNHTCPLRAFDLCELFSYATLFETTVIACTGVNMSLSLGNILSVDLTSKKFESYPADESVLKQFIGGSGFGAFLLAQNLSQPPDPLDPANPLIFAAGPLTGTPVPTSGRHTVISRSPLTGLWGEASVGGTWGRELRRSGLLAIVITGRAESPSYLWVSPEGVELRSAEGIWGRECQESDELLRAETDSKAVAATIGPAGERLVPLAGIFTDGSHARVAARCGMGAVAGCHHRGNHRRLSRL